MINIDYSSSRTIRQLDCVKSWIKNKGKGTIIAPTGTGKTVIALLGLQKVLSKYPSLQTLIVVPTTTLKDQWIKELDAWGFSLNTKVEVINTVIKGQYKYDILIIDKNNFVDVKSL
jgi:superfamily II DNA or RNA helicase